MKKKHLERGQSLVEFAISIVVILLLLSGAVEFGIAFFQYIQLRDAAQDGAVYGSICQDKTKIIQRVRNSSDSPLDLTIESGPDAVTVCVRKEGESGCNNNTPLVASPGDGIEVEVSYQHRVIMPFANLFTGGSNTIRLWARSINTVLNTDPSKTSCQ
jgi:Flp pilus assembly protein TadG